MKHLKLFEAFQNTEELKEDLSHLFIQFEEDGWNVEVNYNQIVPDRNDWTGNLQSTKVRNVWGGEFIDYHKDVVMSQGQKSWRPKDAIIVTISKVNYIKELTNESIEDHWKQIDQKINSRIPTIKNRAEKLDLELYGVHGKWFQLGQASHPDFELEPHYKWDTLIDSISFAFQ